MSKIHIIFDGRIKRSRLAPTLRALWTLTINPKSSINLVFDMVKTYLQSANLRCEYAKRKKKKDSTGKKLMIVSFGSVYATKLESILAAPLLMSGWSISAFIRNRGTFSQRLYYRFFGIEKLIYGAGIEVRMPNQIEIKKLQKELLIACQSINDLKKFKYKEVNLGITLIMTLQRQGLMTNFDPQNINNQNKILAKLEEILRWILVCKKLLDHENPNSILLIEVNDWNRPLVDIAINHGIDVIQMIQPNEDDGIIFKRINKNTQGLHPNSINKETLLENLDGIAWEKNLEEHLIKRYDGTWLLQSRNQPAVNKFNKYQIIKKLGLSPKKKCAVIFSHILWDANLFYGEDIFDGYGNWLLETIKCAIQNDRVNWILKLHPANLWKRKFENVEGEYSEIILLKENGLWPLPDHIKTLLPDTEISTDSLFETVDYGITVRGTVGIELPCYGVRTFTAGTGRYSGLGFTEDFATKESYQNAMKSIEKYKKLDKETIWIARKHAYILFCIRPWKFSSFELIQGDLTETNPLSYNIRIKNEFFNSSIKKPDMDAWMNWFTDPKKPIDYMQR